MLIFPEATPWYRVYRILFAPFVALLALSFIPGGFGQAMLGILNAYSPIAFVVTIFVMAYEP